MHRKGPACSPNKWLMLLHLPNPTLQHSKSKVVAVVSLITHFHTFVDWFTSSTFITYFLCDVRQSTTNHIHNVDTASSVGMNLNYYFMRFSYIQYNMICFKFQLNENCFVRKSQTLFGVYTNLSNISERFYHYKLESGILSKGISIFLFCMMVELNFGTAPPVFITHFILIVLLSQVSQISFPKLKYISLYVD